MSSLPTRVTKERPLHGDREQVPPQPASSVPEVVVAVDARGKLVFVNDAGRRLAIPDSLPEQQGALFGLCREDGMLMQLEETPLACALRSGTAVEMQGIRRTLEGSDLQLAVTASPVRDEQGSIIGAIAVFRDASGQAAVDRRGLAYEELAARMLVAQQEAERERALRNELQARYEEVLRRDEELSHLQQAREEFVGSISHDLRAPVTVIYGQAQFLQQLLDKAGLTGREQRPVNAILTSARRLNNMVKDLVDAARMHAGQMRLDTSPLDLHSCVLELVDGLAGAYDAERILVEAEAGLPLVLADRDRLERILLNLLTNALKFSPPEAKVGVVLTASKAELITAVSDQCPGISPDDLPHLFQPYLSDSEWT